MQPHHPFIGADRNYSKWTPTEGPGTLYSGPSGPFEAVEFNQVSREQVWQDYKENLEYVLDVVHDLLPTLLGRTVISSDHGNLIGERLWPLPVRGYGHPGGVHHRNLRQVPWAIVETGERKSVVYEGVSETTYENTKEQLEALGYI